MQPYAVALMHESNDDKPVTIELTMKMTDWLGFVAVVNVAQVVDLMPEDSRLVEAVDVVQEGLAAAGFPAAAEYVSRTHARLKGYQQTLEEEG